MPSNVKDTTNNIIDQLSKSISDEVGNRHEDDLDAISRSFDKSLNDAVKAFNSNVFDDDGFIKKMQGLELDDSKDRDMVKNVLNNLRTDYASADILNQSEILLRRDMDNICVQMPEMRDVVYVIRDGIVECNVANGQVSRNILFENHDKSETYQSQVKEIERNHKLLKAVKNFIIPKTLKHGEMYVMVTPYAKLFAELEALKDAKSGIKYQNSKSRGFRESVPNYVMNGFKSSTSLYSESNLTTLMESASPIVKNAASDTYKIDDDNIKKSVFNDDNLAKESAAELLRNIEVCNGSSILMEELGEEGFKSLVYREYNEELKHWRENSSNPETHFMEALEGGANGSEFNKIDEDNINSKSYSNIKGCYIKYLDPLRMIPIRMDKTIVGYYYVTTTMDLQMNPMNPRGVVDLSFQNYTKDRNMVDTLSEMIIRSFDKEMLSKNIKLKNEIAEIVMAHKFSEGKLSFIYIPENEVIRFAINEDELGKGHSVLEPSIFPARNFLMLNMFNMLYILNNTTTRIHYLRSSGLNKDYAAQIQRTMRKFQSRRITIDDIYSYSGVLNKVGGMGEMILPAGRNDYKALETDTIEAANNPINTEFLEQQRRQALSGTGVPHLLVINAIDEVDFAKTLEMANTRYLSTIAAYKIDFNEMLTVFYQRILKYDTDMENDVIQSFRFAFNEAKQQDLNITADMINNFNNVAEAVESIYYTKSELEDDNGNATPKRRNLRKELAKKYLPQLDIDDLDDIIKKVEIDSTDAILQQRVNDTNINDDDLEEVVSGK